jgi:hypothetical protein
MKCWKQRFLVIAGFLLMKSWIGKIHPSKIRKALLLISAKGNFLSVK